MEPNNDAVEDVPNKQDTTSSELVEAAHAQARAADEQARTAHTQSKAAWVQAGAAVVALLITGYLAYITSQYTRDTARYVELTEKLVQMQIEPKLDVYFSLSTDEQPQLFIRNPGVTSMLGVDTNYDQFFFTGGEMTISIRSGRGEKVGFEPRDWWHIDKLEPGQIVSKSFADVAIEAAKGAKYSSPYPEGPPKYAVIGFHVTYHRGVDRKRVTTHTYVVVRPGSETEKPTVVGDEFLRPMTWLIDFLRSVEGSPFERQQPRNAP
jgi:hypothetical protein